MGVDQSHHIGPYVVCKDKGKPKTREVRVCSSEMAHNVTSQAKFCAECGSGIVKKTEIFPNELERRVSYWELSTQMDDRLMPVSAMMDFGEKLTDYYISNVHGGGFWETSLDTYVDSICEISPSYIEEGIEKFKQFFAKELELLEKAYSSVEVKWGVVSWCS